MKQKIILSLVAVVAVVGGVATMSAYEAHVINVTAHIENALTANTTPIEFGTVFPQEYLEKQFDVKLSSSFLEEGRVDDITYVIKQKPMPKGDRNAKITVCDEEKDFKEYVVYQYCHYFTPENPGYVMSDGCTGTKINYYDYCYLSLCPFLSKTDGDPADENDTSHASYYVDPTPAEPNSGDEFCEPTIINASGKLAKGEKDIMDTWIVDLKVPPVKGFIGQDWPKTCPFVEQDSQNYGCELWIEVTGISLPPTICAEKADVMLTLDRSGSIDGYELSVLQNAALAFAAALNPEADGVHMGQTSFSTTGTLDLHLTSDKTAIDAAINGLTTGGSTNLYEGILLAKEELDNPGDGHDRLDSESPDFMVIITDGFPNMPGTGDPKQLAIDAANAAKAAGVKIFVVGVGTTPDTTDWLRNNIASGPEYYFDAGNWDELQEILEGIATCEEEPSEKELACIASGGTVGTSYCCLGAGEFPNNCATGACGCGPGYGEDVKICNCPAGYCFDGNSCVEEVF